MTLRLNPRVTQPTADKLISYDQLLKLIDSWSQSPQVSVSVAGEAHSGRKIFLIAVSRPENLDQAAGFQRKTKAAWKSLVVYSSLKNPKVGKSDVEALAATTKPALLVHCGSFGFEASHTEAACQLIDHLLTSSDDEVSDILDKSVVLVMPMVNPDSRELALNQWSEYPLAPGWQGLGNSYGFLMNRDFYSLVQPEPQAVHRVMDDWRPLMALDTHEDMAFLAARRDEGCWVPPFRNPRHKNLDPTIVGLVDEFSGAIAERWRKEGFKVWHDPKGSFISFLVLDGRCDLHFDLHGIPCLFTESARTPGGQTWEDRNRQKVLAALAFIHKAASEHSRVLKTEFDYWAKQVRLGNSLPPKAFIIPRSPTRVRDLQTTRRLVSLLLEHGIQLYSTDTPFPAYVVPMGQPDRALISAMLQVDPWNLLSLPPAMGVECRSLESLRKTERAKFLNAPLHPVRDVRAFIVRVGEKPQRNPVCFLSNCESSVPLVNKALLSGASVRWLLRPAKLDSHRLAAGTFCIEDTSGEIQRDAIRNDVPFFGKDRFPSGKFARLELPKIAVYTGQGADEKHLPFTGETLWALDCLGFPYTELTEKDIHSGLSKHFEVLILASGSAPEMLEGWDTQVQNYQPPWEVPGKPLGLGKKGILRIAQFVERGGRYIGIGSGGGSLACKELGGLADVSIVDQGLGQGRIYLRIEDRRSPILFGYNGYRDQTGRVHPKRIPAFYYCDLLWPRMDNFSGPVFKAGRKAKVLATFDDVDHEEWTEHMERPPLALTKNHPAILIQRRSKGSVVLLGVSLGFRGQWISDYRLLSNSIYSWKIR